VDQYSKETKLLEFIIVSLHICRYFAIIVVIGSDKGTDITDGIIVGSYNEATATQAISNGQPYAYAAGIVNTSDINGYPYSYLLGDGSRSSDGEVNYVNVPLRADTQHVVIVRAHTANNLVNHTLSYCINFNQIFHSHSLLTVMQSQ